MDVLIADALEPEVLGWLAGRHTVHADAQLARNPAGFRRLLPSARAVVLPAGLPMDAALIRQARDLRAIGRLSPSLDHIDQPECRARGIEIVRPSLAGVLAEAEFAVGALLQMLRRVPVVSPEGLLVGRELSACSVGIIGMTPTARSLAELLRAFGSRVVGYDPGLHASDPQWGRWSIAPVGLKELMSSCDAVCVLLPYFSRYRGLLGPRYLDNCKPDQVLVNLSSGRILDDEALADALRTGRLAAAWLDSIEPGQADPGRPLHAIDSLQITPRVAGITLESHLRAAWDVVRRIDELLSTPPGLSSRLAMLREIDLNLSPPPVAPPGLTSGPAPA